MNGLVFVSRARIKYRLQSDIDNLTIKEYYLFKGKTPRTINATVVRNDLHDGNLLYLCVLSVYTFKSTVHV